MSTGQKTVAADAARLRAAPRCGARTRAGTACRAPAVHGRPRCRMHGCGGGKLRRSGAPHGNRNAWKDGYWAAAARLRRRRMTAFIRDMEARLAEMEGMARAHVRNFLPDDASVGEKISDQFRIAFAEDKEILQAVQAEEDRHAGRAKVGLDLDASAGLFRLKINRLLRAEAQAQAAE